MNLQNIEKQILDPTGLVSLHHAFATIQGEGPFAGHRAVFIRLAGCNLQCPMCDTDYTSLGIRKTIQEKHNPTQIVHMVSELAPSPYLVVISGGEPFRQNIAPLVISLIEAGYQVQIETNGTLFVDLWNPDFLTPLEQENIVIICSPKTGRLNGNLLPHIDCFKYIIDANNLDDSDGLPLLALGHPASPKVARPPPGFTGTVYVQPMDEDDKGLNFNHIDAAVKSCKEYGYVLSMQVHKLIGLE